MKIFLMIFFLCTQIHAGTFPRSERMNSLFPFFGNFIHIEKTKFDEDITITFTNSWEGHYENGRLRFHLKVTMAQDFYGFPTYDDLWIFSEKHLVHFKSQEVTVYSWQLEENNGVKNIALYPVEGPRKKLGTLNFPSKDKPYPVFNLLKK